MFACTFDMCIKLLLTYLLTDLKQNETDSELFSLRVKQTTVRQKDKNKHKQWNRASYIRNKYAPLLTICGRL